MENSELGSLVGGVGSAAIGLDGFLSQLPYVGSVFIVLMTVSFTYFFNARIQGSTKSTRGKATSDRDLGIDLRSGDAELGADGEEAAVSVYLGLPLGNEWAVVEHSYRVELIDVEYQ